MKHFLIISSILGLLGIILGAFGAHALKEKIDPEAIKSFETGVRYMMYHVIVLLFVNSYSGFTDQNIKVISVLFLAGILFFSGSIFMISTGIVSAKSIWFVTPIGGLLFIMGWLKMILSFIKAV